MTRTFSSLALLLAIALGIGANRLDEPALSPHSGTPIGAVTGSDAAAVAGADMVAEWEPCCQGVDSGGPRGLAYAAQSTPTGSVGTALLGGWISWADPDLGGDYLATRFPRGTLVRLCTPNRCIVRRSNDFGPSAKIDPPRIADLAVLDWESLCGLPRARGVCRGTVEAIDEIALPPTDTAP